MSILRRDVTTQDWVIFAPERVQRPTDLRKAAERVALPASPANTCPFCPGNERLTPPEIFAERAPNGAGWRVRVFPNRFPALRIEENTRRSADGELFRWMGGCGAHEVIVESPDHDLFLGHQPVDQVEAVLRTLQIRFQDLMGDARFQTIIVFKNHGERAGTSLRHPHFQLIATPVVPHLLRLKHQVATDYFDATGRCLYCAVLEEELAAGQRVLASNDHFAAILPYASHVPFETWIFPRMHQASFGHADIGTLRSLAELLRDVLARMYAGLENPDFNLTINTVARGDDEKEFFLWHIEILPRLATPAGFELGSGMAINTVLPEEATAYLRTVKPPA